MTWNATDGAKVYINGVSVGTSSQERHHSLSRTENVVLTLGGLPVAGCAQMCCVGASQCFHPISKTHFERFQIA